MGDKDMYECAQTTNRYRQGNIITPDILGGYDIISFLEPSNIPMLTVDARSLYIAMQKAELSPIHENIAILGPGTSMDPMVVRFLYPRATVMNSYDTLLVHKGDNRRFFESLFTARFIAERSHSNFVIDDIGNVGEKLRDSDSSKLPSLIISRHPGPVHRVEMYNSWQNNLSHWVKYTLNSIGAEMMITMFDEEISEFNGFLNIFLQMSKQIGGTISTYTNSGRDRRDNLIMVIRGPLE